ncbi:MAG: hypothetical protein LBM69_07080 [Lachnospiraceae bacterium]|jgi:hypothetical protein|nr:hypothetical protein [Lachnospiraceae bacterium]
MERSYVPIRKFYEKCLPAARANGYRYVVCLLARETGVDDLYQTLKVQWDALDDVTGKDFLFLFAGKYIEDDVHSGITYDDGVAIAYTEFMHILNQNPRMQWGDYYDFRKREERAKYTPDLPYEQTKHIFELQRHFGLSRKDIPCLMFTNLDTGKNIRVTFESSNLYALMNRILCEVENAFLIIDELKQRIAQFEDIRRSDLFRKYIAREDLRAGLNRIAQMLLPEYREILLDCMDNLVFGNGRIDDFFLKRLNAFVGISKSMSNIDITDIEYIIENKEPEHSLKNLKRINERIDYIIANCNLQSH